MNFLAPLIKDGYKVGHVRQYPQGTGLVFSNWTARKSRIPGVDRVVSFGLQYFLAILQEVWTSTFFDVPKDQALARYDHRVRHMGIGLELDHLAALHDHQVLPLHFYALPEGSRVPIGVPMFVFWNTEPWAYFLTNMIETHLSGVLWTMCTAATIADRYRSTLVDAAKLTGGDPEFVNFQAHDFSMRGLMGPEAAAMVGAGHLTSFYGTDTLPALDLVETYYSADPEAGPVGFTVPATEHSVMCMGGVTGELETFRRLIQDVYPDGIVSIVSDTWDFWDVLTDYLPRLKSLIMARDGKVVIRPDSGDPVKIICGDPDAPAGSPKRKGAYRVLWETFGGTQTERFYNRLDPHIGLIYGDAITHERAQEITGRLTTQGFCPEVVFGVGSFTYQYNTRDTFGFAVKATYGEVNGQPRDIFKDPATDDGEKRSARGLLAVHSDARGNFYLQESATWDDVKGCAFRKVFGPSGLVAPTTLDEIRARLRAPQVPETMAQHAARHAL